MLSVTALVRLAIAMFNRSAEVDLLGLHVFVCL